MNTAESFHTILEQAPCTALAPMQDVTDLPFWGLMARYGGPDLYFTEYFRIREGFKLEKPVLKSITHNPTGKPAIAQVIGNHVPSLVKAVHELQQHPVAAIDLNLGCPAPVVYRKCAGGGLLREPARVDTILGALREAIKIPFTVKTRIGFDDSSVFDELLALFGKHQIDLLTVHGRTVHEGYRSGVHYDYIARAVNALPCPVLANGNVYSAAKAQAVLGDTGAAGLMIGRGAIRNPWIFHQIRQTQNGETPFIPKGYDVLQYLRDLFETVRPPSLRERSHVQKMKKYFNYIAIGIEPTGDFLHRIRRVTTEDELFTVCEEYLDHDQTMALEPFDLNLKPRDVLAGEHR
ncbi:MAG: tRNA-dihydrouridine synthase family protein [Verrucomicrobiota bacterium]|nr:tRNA-dihydrouridine synthase family protein [Verrucomicrobiota bacterium]